MMTDFVLLLQQIDKLKRHPACSHFLREFLDYIHKSMLVVDVSRREEIGQVTSWLAPRSEACRTNDVYALAGESRSEHSSDELGGSSSLFTRLWKRLK